MLEFKNLHILIVEDLEPMRRISVHCLRMLGVGKISIAKNGEEGFQAYTRERPDIIITDWEMPEMNGIEMVRKIRRSPYSPQKDIPIIMMTGYCAKERIMESVNNGINSFIVKPFSAGDVAKRITNIINKPVDFIVTEDYAGPKRDDCTDQIKDDDIIEKIKANTGLQIKAGTGTLSEKAIKKAQEVISENKIDFIPIASNFVYQLSCAVEKIKNEEEPNRKSIERIIDPIMQIKANSRIFKHELLGDIAAIMLDFIEKINDVDDVVIQIIDANQNTLKHLVSGKKKEELERDGDSLKAELKGAFDRYMAVKYKISQNILKVGDVADL